MQAGICKAGLNPNMVELSPPPSPQGVLRGCLHPSRAETPPSASGALWQRNSLLLQLPLVEAGELPRLPGQPPPHQAACLSDNCLGIEGGHGPWERLWVTGAPAEPSMATSGPRQSGNLLLQKGSIPVPPGTRCPCTEQHSNPVVLRRPGLPPEELVYPITSKDRLEKDRTAWQGQGRHGQSQRSSARGSAL